MKIRIYEGLEVADLRLAHSNLYQALEAREADDDSVILPEPAAFDGSNFLQLLEASEARMTTAGRLQWEYGMSRISHWDGGKGGDWDQDGHGWVTLTGAMNSIAVVTLSATAITTYMETNGVTEFQLCHATLVHDGRGVELEGLTIASPEHVLALGGALRAVHDFILPNGLGGQTT